MDRAATAINQTPAETHAVSEQTASVAAIAKDTAKRQLRAYVVVKAGRLENVAAGGRPKAVVTIKNFGQTPAYNSRQSSVMGFDRFPPMLEPPAESPADRALPDHPLGPGGEMYANASMQRALQQVQIDDIPRGEFALSVVGKILYVDAFGHEQTTRYRLFCGGAQGINDGQMSATEHGNSAT
jgi:hypothetical protein